MRAVVVASTLSLLVAAAACGKVTDDADTDGGSSSDGAVNDAAPTPDTPPGPDATPPDAAPQAQWALQHIDPALSAVSSSLTVVGDDNTVYWAHEGNVGEIVFRSHDVTSGIDAAEGLMPAGSDDFCECGFGGQLIAASGSLWYFANYGQRYNLIANSWSPASYPDTNRRGEAGWGVGQVTVGGSTTEVIISVGGRGSLSSVQAFSPASGVWTPLPPYVIGVDSSVVVGVEGMPYVFGGYGVSGSVNTSARLVDGIAWQTLPDAPVPLAGGSGAHLRGKIYLVGQFGDALQVFDVSTDSWEAPLALPAEVSSVRVTVADERLWLVASTTGGMGFYELLLAP